MIRMIRFGAAAVALALVAAACTGTSQAGTGDPVTETYAPSLGIDLSQMTRTSSGLYYQDLTVGAGAEAAAGSKASVEYTGWLPDGKEFDSGSFDFLLGSHQVVAGFDEGVTGMRVGGVRKLVIPPALGYGAQGSGPIPANAVMVFQMTLKGVSRDGTGA
jgi:FKBP-type peptidyl-prolyl cis-trans isomerase FkpA